jgi:uncharacterized membrane protein
MLLHIYFAIGTVCGLTNFAACVIEEYFSFMLLDVLFGSIAVVIAWPIWLRQNIKHWFNI